jgi:hypothetical protein
MTHREFLEQDLGFKHWCLLLTEKLFPRLMGPSRINEPQFADVRREETEKFNRAYDSIATVRQASKYRRKEGRVYGFKKENQQ